MSAPDPRDNPFLNQRLRRWVWNGPSDEPAKQPNVLQERFLTKFGSNEGDEMEKRVILEGMETMLIRSAGKLFTAPGLECSAASCQCLCTVAARGVPHAGLMAYQD